MKTSRRIELCFDRILFQIARISESVILEGAIPHGSVNRIVIAPEEIRQYVDVSVRVPERHIFEQLNANRVMVAFQYSGFYIRVSTDLKVNALPSQPGLECSVQKLFALICSQPDGTSAYRFRILCEYLTKCRAHGCARLGPLRYDM